MELVTFGHGVASVDELAALLEGAGLRAVVDVRTVPKSRRLPHVWHDALARWIPERTPSTYRWQPALGGFRKPRQDSANIALRNDAFRGYADYMETAQFYTALDELLRAASLERTAVMCSETLWWHCHRRLIADAAVLLHGVEVRHLMHDGTMAQHRLTEGVRTAPDGKLVYDDVRATDPQQRLRLE